MKIALLTIWHENNYGAELQAYATIKFLKNLGHEVEMIDIRLSDCHKSNLNGHISKMVSSFGPAYRKFRLFWKHYIPTTRRYIDINSLQLEPPIADVYMVGSDQVWNPDLTGEFSKLYFLNFGNANIRRVSYASSFGVSNWGYPNQTAEIRELLRQFSYISCREQSGIDILHDVFGVKSTMTLDPTLLHNDYNELTGKICHKNTLVYYPLSKDNELTDFAQKIADQLGLILVNNNHTTRIFGRVVWDRVGIEEWVRNIAESKFVITRSFHGLAFSLIYRRPFAILAGMNNRGTRIINLLEQLGIKDRYYENIQACDDDQPWLKPIDFDDVYFRLNTMRQESINFLKSALK